MLEKFLNDTKPSIRFEILRWIADQKLEAYRPYVETSLEEGNFDYGLFLAHMACLDSLDKIKGPDQPNVTRAKALFGNVSLKAKLRAHLVRYLANEKDTFSTEQLIEWSRSLNPSLKREAAAIFTHSFWRSSSQTPNRNCQ